MDFLSFHLPDIGEDEVAGVAAALRSGWPTTGPRTKQFRAEFVDFGGMKAAREVVDLPMHLRIGPREVATAVRFAKPYVIAADPGPH